MNQTLRPQPHLGEVLPGALTLGLLLLLIFDHDPNGFSNLWAPTTGAGFLAILAGGFLFASWILGTLIDTFRDGVIENIADCKQPMNWTFFVLGDRDQINQLDEYFFSYYKATVNYAVSIFIFVLAAVIFYLTGLIACTTWFVVIWFVALLLFTICVWDRMSLRREITKLTGEPYTAAHAGVYTRIQKSDHGVGVFAIRDIPEGTNIFAGDTNKI